MKNPKNKKVSKKEIKAEITSDVLEVITYSFAKLKDGTAKLDKKGKLDNSYYKTIYKTINELLKAKEKETIMDDGYDQVRKLLLLWHMLTNHFESDPEGEYFNEIKYFDEFKEAYKNSSYSDFKKNILDNPIPVKKITLTITADFLDKELKGIDGIDEQIDFLGELLISSTNLLIEKKKETVILNKSFLKTVIEKDNIDTIDIENLELLLKDEYLTDYFYRKLVEYEKSLINSKDYLNKPAVPPFSHARVDIIEKEINLINAYIRVRIGFKEYSVDKYLSDDKYCFNNDISLTLMFYRLLKTYNEKKNYLDIILKNKKFDLENILIESKYKDEELYKQIIISLKEDIHKIEKIKIELAPLDLTSEAIEINKKEKPIIINNEEIEKIPVIIKREIFIKGFQKLIIPPKHFTPYIECEKPDDEKINNLVSDHFYFINDGDKEKEYTLNTKPITWIVTHTQASFYGFVRACEDLKIFAYEEHKNNKLYYSHFEYIKNGENAFIKNIRRKKSDFDIIKKENFERIIKDEVVKDVIRSFLDL